MDCAHRQRRQWPKCEDNNFENVCEKGEPEQKCNSQRNHHHQFHSIRLKNWPSIRSFNKNVCIVCALECEGIPMTDWFATRLQFICHQWTDERERGKNGAENVRVTLNGRNAGLPFWNCAKNSYVDRVAKMPVDTWHSFNVQFRIYHSFDHIDAFTMTVSVRLAHSHWRPIAAAA